MEKQPDSTVKIEKPGVAVSQETKWVLVVIGVFLVIAAIGAATINWTNGGETTETTKPGKDATVQTEKVTKTKNGPSESLLTALLGAGAGLIVIGFLYGRISSIKLPGGTVIGLNAEEKKAATQKAIEANPDDPKKAAEVALASEDRLLAQKLNTASVSLPEKRIDEVVQAVTAEAEEP